MEIVVVFDNDPRISSPFPEVPVLHGWSAFEQWYSQAEATDYQAVIAIGGDRGRDRVSIGRKLAALGILPAAVLHPSAYVAGDATIGEGCQILAHATVGSQARLGDWAIVNTAASIDHDCVAAEGIHIAPGATVAGGVRIGAGVMIGSGAVIAPHVIIGEDAIVGAGSVVLRDVAPKTVVVGNPARLLRNATR